MAKKSTRRKAAGRSKGPAARRSKKLARTPAPSVARGAAHAKAARKTAASTRFSRASQIARQDRHELTKARRDLAKQQRTPRRAKVAKPSKAAAAKSTTKARPSAIEIPMGKGTISYVRFDTPKSQLIRAAFEKYARTQPGVPMKTVLFGLMKTGLDVLTGKTLFSKTADEKSTDLQEPIASWSEKKWPEAEDRPATKALIFLVLAAGLESAAHVPASALSTVGKRSPAAPKKPSTKREKKLSKLTATPELKKKLQAAFGKKATAGKVGRSLRVSKEGDQGGPVDDVPAIPRNEPNDDAEREADED